MNILKLFNPNICKICRRKVDTENEAFAQITDYVGKVKGLVGYYHRKCLNDLINGKCEIMRERMEKEIYDTFSKVASKIIPKIKESLEGEKDDFRIK